MIDRLDWSAIASRAATLDERLSGRFEPTSEEGGREAAEANLRRWMDSAAQGDSAWFKRRLARDGLTVDGVLPLLGPVRPVVGSDLPGWVATARRLLEAVLAPDAPRPPEEMAENVPFADLFWPAVTEARARRGDAGPDVIAPEALDILDRALIERMAEIYALTVLESFDSFRAAGPEPMEGSEPGRGLYDAFIAALREGPLLNLIAARPVMIRLLAVVVEQWIAATREFLDRLAADRDGFAEVFPELREAGPVSAVETGVSDPHNHGRGVVILTFANGRRLVYKPRSVGVEVAWHGVAEWCARRDAPVRLGAAAAWPRDGYGWMGFVEGEQELAVDAAPVFYRDVGGLLAVMHWMRGSDLHLENVLVRDGSPVPIDLETLLQPNLRFLEPATEALHAESEAQYALDASVLCIGLLPRRQSIVGRVVQVGGLAPRKTETVPDRRFTAVNRDDMAEERFETENLGGGIALEIGGEPADIADYADDVIAGFRDTVAFLDGERDSLFAPDGPLAVFESVTIRHVLRPTAYYEGLRRQAGLPENQGDGVAWSRHFERLGRNLRWDLDDDPGWPLLPAERAALARYDIPLLTGGASAGGCLADGSPVAPALLDPAVWPRLAGRLDEVVAEVGWQAGIAAQTILAEAVPVVQPPQDWKDAPQAWNPGAARSMAFDIARLLAEQALRRDGAAAWVGADVSDDGKAIEPRVLKDSLYSGNAGIALFLAACFRAGGEAAWRDLALEALAAPRHRIVAGASMGIGGFEGLGGLVYAFTRTACLLDAPELLDDARRAAARIDRKAVAADRLLDVIGGAAGAVLGLLSLYRETGEAAVLDRAVACGCHIPALPAGDGSGGRDWRGVAERPLAGFSHGAAGISYALLRLHEATGEAAFLETARRGLDFERALFDFERRNWPDLRDDGVAGYPVQWCHGASGIGLARLAALHVLDTPEIRADIEAAISATLAWRDYGRDHLCCGNAGRFSILGFAARTLGDASLARIVDARMAGWLARAGDVSGFRLLGVDPALRLGLLQGLAGVGQSLLEHTDPGALGTVLALT